MIDEIAGALFGERWRIWSARRAKPMLARDLVVGARAAVHGVVRTLGSAPAAVAPFTQRRAVAYHAKLFEELSTSGTETSDYRVVIDDLKVFPFAIEIDDGLVQFEGPRVLFAVPEEDVSEFPHVNDGNPSFKAYLERHGKKAWMYMGMDKELLFREHVHAPGDRVIAWGRVGEAPGIPSASGYRDASTRAKVITGTPADPCVLLRP